jgi:PadR family transcriptional regulator, regulatory protein PadR
MPKSRTELVKGTLDLMILRTLELQPMHGAAIAERIEQTTRGTFQVKAGSLFPALHRLEQEGWIAGEWTENAEKRRVKSYILTAAGRKQLNAERATWRRIVTAMDQVLESS